jgi:branched-chain amino acid transport system ATP-binding protein
VTDGTVAYRGERIDNRPPHQVTARGVTLVPERSKVFENLTVAENIDAVVPRNSSDRRLAEAVWEYFPALARLRRREAGYLSGGERQMLAIGSALACGPELLLVDELSQGLAPLIVEELLDRLKTIRRDLRMTLLLVEQNAALALEVADYAYVMENGRIVLDGTPERLRGHPDIQEFYLGTGVGTGSGKRRNYRDVKQYRRSRRWYG